MSHLPDFKEQAVCASSDPEMWFDYEVSGGRVTSSGEHGRMARSICLSCPALQECLEYSMQYTNLWGIWGGLDHLERARIQREKNLETINFQSTYNSLFDRKEFN